jgi:hypothetical protein
MSRARAGDELAFRELTAITLFGDASAFPHFGLSCTLARA